MDPSTRMELVLERAARASRSNRPADAMRAYSEILSSVGASARQKAIAAFNRGVLFNALGHEAGAIGQWEGVIFDSEAPRWIRLMAWYSRALVRFWQGDALGAISDATGALAVSDRLADTFEARIDAKVLVPPERSPRALSLAARVLRGAARSDVGDLEGAVEDLSFVAAAEGVDSETRAEAFAYLGATLLLARKPEDALVASTEATRIVSASPVGNLVSGIAYILLKNRESGITSTMKALPWIKSPALTMRLLNLLHQVEALDGIPIPGTPILKELLNKRLVELNEDPQLRPSGKLNRLNC